MRWIAPHALVDAEKEVDRDLDRHGDHEGKREVRGFVARKAVGIQQERRGEAGQDEGQAIVQCSSQRAGVELDCFHRDSW
jgi:hypothetical protein